MSAKMQVSSKHALIDKNNARIVAATAIASALAIFAIVGGRAMLSRMSYQRHVASQQSIAISQIQGDINSLNTLNNQYQIFATANPNLLGVSSSGSTGDQGSNARIVLDALPSEYDFPALTSSIEKILADRGLKPSSLGGQDNGASANNAASPNPTPQNINFNLSITTDYDGSKALIADFERSIRPFKVLAVDLSGSNSQLTVSLQMQTYYQPTKVLSITSKEVK